MVKLDKGRKIAVIIGVLWLIDGLLQLQPKMFTSQFASSVIAPAADGQNHYYVSLIHFFIRIFLTHPAIFNSFISVIQLSLGIFILYKPTTRLALYLSIPWSLFVWFIGEGMGGLLSANGNLIVGFPGAALIYALLAAAAIRRLGDKDKNSFHGYFLVLAWACLWIMGAVYQLLPSQGSLGNLVSNVSPMSGQPGWLYSLNSHISAGLGNLSGVHQAAMSMSTTAGGYWLVILMAVIELIIGIGIFLPSRISSALVWLGILLSFVFWILGQGLGGYYTGLATDPNSGPLFIILGLVILSLKHKDKYLAYIKAKIEPVLT